jgi:predicted Zn-dependent protease
LICTNGIETTRSASFRHITGRESLAILPVRVHAVQMTLGAPLARLAF